MDVDDDAANGDDDVGDDCEDADDDGCDDDDDDDVCEGERGDMVSSDLR